jgi:hypothetical protein
MLEGDFDLERLRYVPAPATDAPEMPGEVSDKPKRARKGLFVKVPLEWVDRLTSARASGNTCILAIHLLHEKFKNRRSDVKLANGALALDGISRNRKWVVLGILEKLGLVTVERRPKKSPIVTLLQVGAGD